MQNNFLPSLLPPALALLLLLAAAGCTPQNPCEAKIEAATPAEFDNWLMFTDTKLEAAKITEMNACIREIKIHLQTTGAATTDAEAQLRAELNGKPLKWLFIEGSRLRIERLEKERQIYVDDLKYKDTLQTKPGDTESEDYLAHQKNLMIAQIEQFTDDINQAKVHYRSLLQSFGLPVPAEEPEPDVFPAPPAAQKPEPPDTPEPMDASDLDEAPQRIN